MKVKLWWKFLKTAWSFLRNSVEPYGSLWLSREKWDQLATEEVREGRDLEGTQVMWDPLDQQASR